MMPQKERNRNDAQAVPVIDLHRGLFLTWYAQQSCTAGRAAFITGQSPIRTGLTKVGMPGADVGLRPEDPTIAEVLKPLGYMNGQFGKNHLPITCTSTGTTCCRSSKGK